MDLFGNLSYKQKDLAPIGHPIDQLTKLYEKKQSDFDYVVDNTNLMDTALSNLQYNPQDADKVSAARDHFKSSIDSFNVEGDLENKVLDTKKLVNDLNNQYGLLAIQQDAAKRSQYISDLKEQYSKGDISKLDMDRAIQYSDSKHKGVQKDADGKYSPGYSGRAALRDVDLSKMALDVANGVAADSIIDENGESYKLEKTANGFINVVTGEAVTEDKVAKLTKNYLLNNNDFKDRVNEEVFYDLDALLTDPETNERRDMTIEDLAKVTGNPNIEEVLKEKYGENNLDNIDPALVYKSLKSEQLVTKYIQPAITKESFIKIKNDFKKDWQLADSLKNSAATKAEQTIREAGIAKTYATVDKLTSADFARTSEIYGNAKDNIKQLTSELNTLKNSDANPDQLNRKQEEINNQQRLVNLIESKNQKLIELTPALKSQITDFVDNFMDTGQNRSEGKPFIHGLSINQGELERLVFSSSSGTLNDEELKKYIDFEAIKKDANSEEGARLVYDNSLKVLRDKVSQFGSTITDRIEKGDVTYNENYRGIQLPDNLSAEEKRMHPVARWQNQTNQLKEQDPQYFTGLIDVNTNLPIASLIEEQDGFEDEDGEIDWESGKLTPLFDKIPNSSGGYDTAIAFDVKVGDDPKNMKYKRYIVRSDEDTFNSKSEEFLEDYRRQLLNKSNLTSTDKELLTTVNLSRFNSTKEGQEMDLLNLAKMSNREVVNIPMPNGLPDAQIQAFKKASPQNMAYYLVSKEGDNVMYWVENSEGVRKKVTEDELKTTSDYRALGGNSIRDIKTKIANTGYNSGAFINNDDYRVNIDETVNIANYFGQDHIKDDVNPRIHKDIEDNVKFLKDLYPNIYLTDGLRPENTETGAENSFHKYGKALDLRLNNDSRNIVNMDADRKRRLGIKKAEIHKDHVHIEFL